MFILQNSVILSIAPMKNQSEYYKILKNNKILQKSISTLTTNKYTNNQINLDIINTNRYQTRKPSTTIQSYIRHINQYFCNNKIIGKKL